MKLTNRINFDYNATSPLAESVKHFLANGDVDFLNPSSLHAEGRSARKSVNLTTHFLKNFFNLKNYNLVFHSGATEGLNTAMYSFLQKNPKGKIITFKSDHPAVANNARNEHFKVFDIQSDGSFPENEIRDYLKSISGPVLLNYLFAHNETGKVWPIEAAVALKRDFPFLSISVDAVQSVGKVESYKKLSEAIDCYTFSGHKFGALKGIGFSFIHPEFHWQSPFYGGGQQQAMRPGTENVLAIVSLELALRELDSKIDFKNVRARQNDFSSKLNQALGTRGAVLNQSFEDVATNNLSFFYQLKKADVVVNFLDMHDVCVSAGSACSSGAMKPSPTLLSMGKPDLASHFIRVTLPPFCGSQDQQNWDNFIELVKKLP